jgi:formamidopyrimidine-DNA glycosylase
MPELPEVEIARQQLTEWTEGRSIQSVVVEDKQRVTGAPTQLIGGQCVVWQRQGKLLLGTFNNGLTILAHLGMTGKWVANPEPERPHQRFHLHLEEGRAPKRVVFIDARRFGFVDVVSSSNAGEHPRVRSLGPDALDSRWSPERLKKRLGSSRSPLKQKLMDQHAIAGLGNIAASEIAWRARLHPHTPANGVTLAQWAAIAEGMTAHLEATLAAEEGPEIRYQGERNATNPFSCYGREGEPCGHCGFLLCRVVLSGRPTFYCPHCQPRLDA